MTEQYYFFPDRQTVKLLHLVAVKVVRQIPIVGLWSGVELVLADFSRMTIPCVTDADAVALAQQVSEALKFCLNDSAILTLAQDPELEKERPNS